MYICFQNESALTRNDKKMKNSQLYKGSLNTIIMKLLEERGMGMKLLKKVIIARTQYYRGRFVSRPAQT
jgi:hypothetical protein